MENTLNELEDRVRRVTTEMRELRRRRDELEAELAELRGRAQDKASDPAAWQTERIRIVAALRDAVGELRGD
jgi:chromosome segregation ATPase